MKFQAATKYPARLDALILHFTEGDSRLPRETATFDKKLGGLITRERKDLKLKGKVGEAAVFRVPGGKPASRIILVGVGKRPVELDRIRKATAAAVKQARALHMTRVATPATGGRRLPHHTVADGTVEGTTFGDYRFTKYKEVKERPKEITFYFVTPTKKLADVRKGIRQGSIESRATLLARDLVNEPPNEMDPIKLAAAARRIARQSGLQVKVIGRKEIERLGLRGYLAVSKGSDVPPQFIRLRYSPPRAKKHLVLVGKSVTFDAGGINLKPSRGGMLEQMKMDMAGGAAVLGAMSAMPSLKFPHKVTGYLPATENLLGGAAYKPGDVIKTYNGKTIEIGNTDAEGRVTLVDVLAYTAKVDKPDLIVDLATLTATDISLGPDYAAVFSNREKLIDTFRTAGDLTGEKVWPLPMPDEYQETTKSQIADYSNIVSGRAYTLSGPLLLKNFVNDIPWVHLDIGSSASSESDRHYLKTGGTGFGVRLLLESLQKF